MYCLYKIVNAVNDKIYIGVTNNPKSRWKQHIGPHSNCVKLKRAIEKYGPDKFSMEILCMGEEDYIIDLEYKAIELFGSTEYGYNLLSKAERGKVSHHESSKRKVSDSLRYFYANNENPLTGRKVDYRSDDVPIYVTGFWFTNRRVCLDKLTINEKSIYKWQSQGTLGDVQHLRKTSVKDVPCYVGGFWFPTMVYAAYSLNNTVENIKMQIARGKVEALPYKSSAKLGDKNPMFGKTGSAHHNSKQIKINGIVYGSIADAVRQTEFTKSMIEKRLKNKAPGFDYVTALQEIN